ncbi:MAG TPA: DUF2849 domain-containing protein [Stellaceae bacterium]|nr:DUF2849 domain-containing protein [Stellaceae bacterium]
MASKSDSRSTEAKAVVTANRLKDGRVVWLTADQKWVEDFRTAKIFVGPEIDAGVAEGAAAEKRLEVVAAYAVDVDVTEIGPVPVKTRERVRVLGPSVRTDLAPPALDLFPLIPDARTA